MSALLPSSNMAGTFADEKTPLLRSGGSSEEGQSTNFSITDINAAFRATDQTNGQVAFRNVPNRQTSVTASMGLDKVHPIALSWRDINVTVRVEGKGGGCCHRREVAPPTEKRILKNVSGVVQPGSLLAIMGASGAGKSTLLNVLTHRNTKGYIMTGDIRLNGWHIGDGIKNVSAYVQQDDLFISTLTVREQLQFRALLRMDKRLSKTARLARVEEVISEMGLTVCADTRIGEAGGSKKGISGGERKRLSFASEALTNPPIFFCDEPTSGLDTFMAQSIVNTLQKMASKGRAILCTIHQPSSELYSMFNQILLLAEGRIAYMGSAEGAIQFFDKMQYPCPRNYNPADHYILTLAIVPGQEEECRTRCHTICDTFANSEEALICAKETDELEEKARQDKHDVVLDAAWAGQSSYEASMVTQFRYLFWRSWISLFRDVILFRVRLMQTTVVGLVLGLVYLQTTLNQKGVMDINGAIFLLITNTTFSNMFAVINSFPLEMAIFLREYGTGLYRSDVYYVAKTFAEVPMFCLISIVFTTVTYWMMGLYESLDAYLIATGTLLLVANISTALAYLISTICGSVTVSLAVAPPTLIPLMLFGGLFVNSGNIPVYFVWLEYVSWFKYSNEVLMVNQWRNIDYIPCEANNGTVTTPNPLAVNNCLYRRGEDVLRYTSFDEDDMVLDVLLLVALFVVLRLLSLFALVVRARRSKE